MYICNLKFNRDLSVLAYFIIWDSHTNWLSCTIAGPLLNPSSTLVFSTPGSLPSNKSHLTVCKLYCKLPSTSQELALDQRMCPRYCEAQTIRANWAIQRWLTCRVVCKLQIPSTLCCKSIRSFSFLWCKIPMFRREGGKPLPLAFQYLIFMV